MVSVSSAPRRHHVVQAPVRALDPDGTTVFAVGTLAFAVASVVLGLRLPELDAAGQRWRWWVALVGTGMGLAGWVVARLRAARHSRS